jgi:hypothetical protein
MAYVKCIFMAREFQKQGWDLVTLDISNAFCSLSWEVIANAMKKNKVPANIAQYILNVLKIRYSSDTGQLKQGCA